MQERELDSNDKLLLSRAMVKVQAANETLQFLSDWFRDKYGLTPQNQITPDGRIITPSSLENIPLETNGQSQNDEVLSHLSS